MRTTQKLFLAVVLLMAGVTIWEIWFQYANIVPVHGRLLITFRMAIILHVVFYLALGFIFYTVLRAALSDKEKINNSLIFIVSLFASLVVGEVIVRYSGKVAVYSERRGGYYLSLFQQPVNGSPYHTHGANTEIHLKTGEFHYIRKTNSLGLRFPDIPLHKDSNEIRIMALGDSFTDGDGAPQDSAWLNSLEVELRKQYPAQNFTFINAGVCGSDVVAEYKLYADKLQNYQPDIVLVATNISDKDDISLRGGFERFITKDSCIYKNGPWWESVYAISHLFRLCFLRNSNNLLLTDNEYNRQTVKSERIIINAFEKFYSLTENNGATFVAILMPAAIDFNKEQRFSSLGGIPDMLKNSALPVINMYECYSAYGINGNNVFDYYWKIDGHHNSRGYQVFGKCVADYFMANKLLDGRINLSRR